MNFNLLTFCCIAVICLIYHQLFKSKITLTITLSCSTILLIAFTNFRAQSAIILMVLLLLAVSFRSSKLARTIDFILCNAINSAPDDLYYQCKLLGNI